MLSNTAVNDEQLRKAEPVDIAQWKIHQQSSGGTDHEGRSVASEIPEVV